MTTELKPCPFCKSDGYVKPYNRTFPSRYVVKCKQCEMVTSPMMTVSDAVYVWNTRPIEDALQARITELEYQLANYKAAADGTTHWCAGCKMKQDRIAELENRLETSVSKMELDTCRALNEALRQREDRMRKAMLNAGFVWRDDEFNEIEKEKE